MIRADMIPDEVVEAAAYQYRNFPPLKTHNEAMRASIAAALSAWPGAGVEGYTTPHLILPLPQEASDD